MSGILYGRWYVGFIDPWTDEERLTEEEVVRCADCCWFGNDAMHGAWCKFFGASLHDDRDGFCAWGSRKDDSE